MTHKTEITDYKQVSNNQFSVIITCCGEHQHEHTMAPQVLNSEPGYTSLEDSLAWAHKEAARNHEAALQWKQRLEALKGTTVDHAG